MDPFSQKLKKKYTKETIQTNAESQPKIISSFLMILNSLVLKKRIFEGHWPRNPQREDSTNAMYCKDTPTFIEEKVSIDTLKGGAESVKTKILLRPECKEHLYIIRKEREEAYIGLVANITYASATFDVQKKVKKYKLDEQQSSSVFMRAEIHVELIIPVETSQKHEDSVNHLKTKEQHILYTRRKNHTCETDDKLKRRVEYRRKNDVKDIRENI
ncbi:hypothetical protein CWI39_0107p0010 [Hamiltosporidium magnivora]|uniref:Uncharacterized protein n=1 Tax=Hamiltosporidium magnivora TaxID=148818 RepID=A0A4Q9LLG9_9MICR|nr:hypothetical protein CWI39_0107p0010 [Hamiltosporidium magnivora]